MKLQKHCVLLFLLSFLVSSLIPTESAVAQREEPDETERKGLILFDLPGAPEAKVEVNLTARLMNLVTATVGNAPEVAGLIQMLDGIYVRTYDKLISTKHGLVDYLQQRLKENNWEVLVKIKEDSEVVVQISLLFDEGMVHGIFVIVSETSGEVTFVNMVGKIAPDRIEDLLGNMSNFGVRGIDVDTALKPQAIHDSDTVQRELFAVKVEKAPIIDGNLDDACWKIAPEANNFTQARDGNPVEDDTTVKLIYTDQAIYVAWQLYDSEADKIVARQNQDGVRFGMTEDWVSFSIDPFHTHQFDNRTFFMANPLGTRFVRSPKGKANETEWLEQWNLVANINASGWMVEMEIPWEMLDYPDTAEPIRMGINFDRGQARTSIRSWWSNLGVEEAYENDGHWLYVLPPRQQ